MRNSLGHSPVVEFLYSSHRLLSKVSVGSDMRQIAMHLQVLAGGGRWTWNLNEGILH